MAILSEIQQMMGELQCEPENFTGRIIFMSMFHDIVRDAKGNDELCLNLAVIGLSQGLDLKRSGTELTIANQMDLGIELQRKCSRICQDPVIRYSVVPVLWREDNYEAMKEERHQYTPMEVRRILSCFSRWSSPSISSVCTEQ